MRTSIALLAGLAGSALALPATPSTQLDTRTFGLISGIIHTIENILTGGVTPANVLSGISSEAAAALQGGALGCTAGSVDLAYRKKLAHWLKAGDGVHLEASVRKALLAWCEADASVDSELDLEIRAGLGFFIPTCAKIAAEADLYVNLDGVFELATDALAVLSATAQAALEAAIALLGEVDWRIKAGLEFCAAGGVVGDLDSEIIHALKVWLNGSECTLAVSLKKTLLLWIEGKVGGDVVSIGNLPVGGVATIGLGKSLEALVGVNGALVAGAQAQLEAFLQTDVGLEIDVAILDILKICAKGGLAVDIDLDKRVELSLWLASSKCSLSAELKGLLAFWLSFGVSAETDLSLSVSTNIISELTGFLTGTIDSLLGTQLHGLLSFILGGEGVLSLSLEARAQLAALIGGGVGIEIDDSIQIILIGWLTGCQKCCGGSQVTHGPSVPSSTPALPASETPSLPVIPTGAQPTETPSVPAGTPAAPTDVSPTDTETPASPSETPCDTITSESVTSYTVSESASVPAGTETPAVPTDVQPTETPAAPTETPAAPAESTETPCETLTSDSVTSYTVSETASVPAGTETPAAPTDVQPTETPAAPTETPAAPAESTETPCETLTSDSVTSYTVSETASVPAGTETPAAPTDVQPTETPAAPTETPAAPAESTETPCETLTSDSVTSYTVSETASVPAGTETPAVPTNVQPTETPAAPTETPAAPAESTETPCETITSDSVTSYTVSQTTSVPAIPTEVSPSSTSCAGCGGIKTVTVTKTVGIEACPTDF